RFSFVPTCSDPGDLCSCPTRRSSDLDAEGLMKYTFERVPAFVNAFAPLDDVTVSCGAGAIALGFPVITNETENIFRVPKSLIVRSEEHRSELQSRFELVCRLLLDKKN